jgi:predicted PhzF superfamily epimerase YddE/YHI9
MSSGAPFTVHVVRVFTTPDGARGNPLGILESTDETRGHEQEIATRLGFSETVFIDGVDGDHDDDTARVAARIRIFTPASELPFAGHPTVGTAWWLRAQGRPVAVLAVPAGDVGVRYEGDLTWVTARGSWSPEFTWHALETPADIDELDPQAFASGHHYAYAFVDEQAGRLRSRMFAPLMGIVEDEATGSAAVRLTAKLGRDLDVVQGGGSRLSTRLLSSDLVDLGGRVVRDPDVSVHID